MLSFHGVGNAVGGAACFSVAGWGRVCQRGGFGVVWREQAVDAGVRGRLVAGYDAGIDLEKDVGAMAEPPGGVGDRDAGVEEHRGVGMT